MAKKKGEDPAPSGPWLQQNLQVPRDLALLLRAEADRVGAGGVKISGTAALVSYLALPSHVREALNLWVTIALRRSPDLITPEGAKQVLAAAVENPGADFSGTAEWFVNRILDPEVTPEPGRKKSDMDSGKSGRKAS